MKRYRNRIILVIFSIFLFFSEAIGTQARLPKNIEDDVGNKVYRIEQLIRGKKSGEAFKLFKEMVKVIGEKSPAREKELREIGRQSADNTFLLIFELFMKSEDYSYAEEISATLRTDFPYNFSSIITTGRMGHFYYEKLNNRAKAMEYSEYVVNNCVPRFYSDLNKNAYCSEAAERLVKLYGDNQRAIEIWNQLNRLPKDLESQIIEKCTVIAKLLNEKENDKAFEDFKKVIAQITDYYPTRSKELFKIGERYVDSLFEGIFNLFLKNGDYPHAEEMSTILLEEMPHNWISLRSAYNMGNLLLYKLGDFTKSTIFFEKVVNNCVPKFHKTLTQHSVCYDAAMKLAILYEGDGRSENIWKRIVKEDPNHPSTKDAKLMLHLVENYSDYDKKPLKLYFKANLLLRQGKRGGPIDELPNIYQTIIDGFPQWKMTPYIHYLLGEYFNDRYWYEEDNSAWAKAIAVFSSFLDKYPEYSFPAPLKKLKNATPTILMKIGDLYQRTDPRQSIIWYQKIIEKYCGEIGDVPSWGEAKIVPFAYLRIGWMYESKINQYKDAISAYKKVIKEYPDYTEEYLGYPALTAHFRIVRIYEKYLKEFESAKKELLKIFETYPNRIFFDRTVENDCDQVRESKAEASSQLARLYLREKSYDKSLDWNNVLLKNYYDLLYGVAESEACGRYGERAIFEIIKIYIAQKKPTMAIKKLQDLASNHKSTWIRAYAQYKLGELYEKDLKDKNSAIKEYKKVLKNFPDTTNNMTSSGPANLAEEKLKILEKRK